MKSVEALEHRRRVRTSSVALIHQPRVHRRGDAQRRDPHQPLETRRAAVSAAAQPKTQRSTVRVAGDVPTATMLRRTTVEGGMLDSGCISVGRVWTRR